MRLNAVYRIITYSMLSFGVLILCLVYIFKMEGITQLENFPSTISESLDMDGTTCHLEPLRNTDQYYNFILFPTAAWCIDEATVGNYQVCMDNITKSNCLVYSFGIANHFDFDDSIVQLKDCQVHSFDPTMGVDDHKRGTNIQFHNLGISNYKGSKTMSYIGKKNINTQVDTLYGIIQMLNHTDDNIDVLKLDIEGSELDVILDVAYNYPKLFKKVKQLIMEIHTLEEYYWHTGNSVSTTLADYWKVIQILECQGFHIMYSVKIREWGNIFTFKDKTNGKTRSCCYETSWIKK